MNYLGDFVEDSTIYIYFTTHEAETGAPVAPSSAFESADVSIYKNGSATQKATTNGLTMTSPFDSVTGLHLLAIDTSNDTGDAGFWAAGGEYSVVLIPDETVDGSSVLKVLSTFSIERTSGALAALKARLIGTVAAGTHNPQSGDSYTRIGAPVGASISADVAVVDGNVDSILTDTGDMQPRVVAIETDTNELQTNQGDWATAVGFSTHSAADVVNEFETQSQADPTGFHVNVMEVNGTAQTANDNGADINAILTDTSDMQPRVVAIETDTNELQTDDIPGTLATIDGKIDTAQSDLDTITGADGVTLATAQGNYAPSKAGDEMDLIDDAITSGKYDESTAFPVKSADTGATEIARTGADGDTLEDISDQIDAVPTASEIQTEMEENGASILDTLQDRLTAARAGYIDELDFDLQAAISALNDISVSDITSAEVDNDGTAISLAGAFKLILAVLTGKSAGGGTATLTFRNIADSKNRISATVDSDGNRTAIGTRDAS
jgi:hypothetical protein